MTADARSPWLPDANELRQRSTRRLILYGAVFLISLAIAVGKLVEFVATPQWTFIGLLDLVIWVTFMPIMFGYDLTKTIKARKLPRG